MLPDRGRAVASALAAAFLCAAGSATAGAWPMPKGEGQVIVKYEGMKADEAYDLDGSVLPMFPRTDESLSAFVEYGLTRRLTLQGQLGYTQGEDVFTAYDGRAPTQIGLRATVLRTDRSVISVYAGGTLAGEGRNADFAAPSQGDGDLELRLLAGRSGVWRRRPVFAEVQLARLSRSDLPDETRLESTIGIDVTPRWTVLLQNYSGLADGGDDAPAWLKGELSVVRRLGPWRLQAGWRQSQAGRNVPLERGPVLAVWRAF